MVIRLGATVVEPISPDVIRTTDVGSYPLVAIDMTRYSWGAADLEGSHHTEVAKDFIRQHNDAFTRKMRALGSSISAPCYVQGTFERDMISQFLDPIVRHGRGLQKQANRYLWDGTLIQLPSEKAQVAELLALKHGAKTICQEFEIDSIQYRACITGPFELASRLWRDMGIGPRYDESLIESFAAIVRAFMKNAQIETKYLKPLIITLDEPSIGVAGVGDLFMDTDTDDRLNHLIDNWNTILSTIPSCYYRGIHLHSSPYHQLASANWNLLEAHQSVIVSKSWLVEHNKYIRAAVMRTDGPTFSSGVNLRKAWDEILSGNILPYLQPQEEMWHYLEAAVTRYGSDQVPFAGPECGLGPWNWRYGEEMVLASLENLQQVVTSFNQSHKL
ncbi:MAG: hypothetical protein ACFE9D_12180 [Promethearchaeota archaeon]